uniref:Uncharacterized protein n=1 Tax=Pelusios castaneus TaxID=367368 RepID=A0A8C8RBF3_9SAUR
MHDHQQGGASDKYELQGPEADVGDGEIVVVADIGAAGLLGVAVKVLLLIPPHTFCRHHIHQHTEDENHREPDAPEGCGVLVHPAQKALKCLPVHGDGRRGKPNSPEPEKSKRNSR